MKDHNRFMDELEDDKRDAEAFGIPFLRYREIKEKAGSDYDLFTDLIMEEINKT